MLQYHIDAKYDFIDAEIGYLGIISFELLLLLKHVCKELISYLIK